MLRCQFVKRSLATKALVIIDAQKRWFLWFVVVSRATKRNKCCSNRDSLLGENKSVISKSSASGLDAYIFFRENDILHRTLCIFVVCITITMFMSQNSE